MPSVPVALTVLKVISLLATSPYDTRASYIHGAGLDFIVVIVRYCGLLLSASFIPTVAKKQFNFNSRSSDFEITSPITPWIVLHSVQLLLLNNYSTIFTAFIINHVLYGFFVLKQPSCRQLTIWSLTVFWLIIVSMDKKERRKNEIHTKENKVNK